MIYDDFRFIGARDTVLEYADLLDTRWDGILLSMTQIQDPTW